jgi:hypothetical protein
MSDSSIHYALLLLPLLWVGVGAVTVCWAALRERRARAQATPLPLPASPPVPAWPVVAAVIEGSPLMKEPPLNYQVTQGRGSLPSIDEVAGYEVPPPSEPVRHDQTQIGVAPPAPGSRAPLPAAQTQTRSVR